MKSQDIKDFDQRLAEQVRCRWENYVVKRIDLSIARTDQELNLAGEFLCIERASSQDANATVKLNRNTNDPLFLQEDATIETLFGILFLSNEAQANEWIDLIVGVNFAYKKKHKIILSRGLPKTGQSYHYRHGDDGHLEAGWWIGTEFPNLKTRFIAKTVNGDDVVIDLATGLMWVADEDTPICNDSMNLTWNLAIDLPLGVEFAGFTDWRLANVNELLSIINRKLYRPAIEEPPFANTPNVGHWSSTTYKDDASRAWRVDFTHGAVTTSAKGSTFCMRVVRGGV